MNTYIAFVRNVMQGREGLTKELLVQAFEQAGALNIVTHLTTGNVSFCYPGKKIKSLKAKVESALAGILNKTEPVFIINYDELIKIDFEAIFSTSTEDVYERCITFVDKAFTLMEALPLQTENKDLQILQVEGRFVFSITRLYNNRPGNPNKWVEKQALQSASTRNINTVLRILKRSGTAGR